VKRMFFSQEKIKNFSAMEKNVYEYIQKNPQEIDKLQLRELATKLHVSTATILRFCKKMDCSGYAELKFKVKENLAFLTEPATLDEVKISINDFRLGIVDDQEFESQIAEVVKLMRIANKIIFIGIGTSGIMAKYGSAYLTTMGKSAQYVDTSNFPIPIEDHQKTLIIALSSSGQTTVIADRIMTFRELGARIVTITNGCENTIAKLADIALYYAIPEEEFIIISPTKSMIRVNGASQIPTIYLIETLVKNCVGTTRYIT